MPDIDRIIEAEQSIQELAEQLNRMHSAANILQNSKVQVEAVLQSSKRVVQITETFTDKVNRIVSKLGETDFDNKFNGIKNEISELGSLSKDYQEEIIKILREQSNLYQDNIEKTHKLINEETNLLQERFSHSDSLITKNTEFLYEKEKDIQGSIDKNIKLNENQVEILNTSFEGLNEKIDNQLLKLDNKIDDHVEQLNNRLNDTNQQLDIKEKNIFKWQVVTLVVVFLVFISTIVFGLIN